MGEIEFLTSNCGGNIWLQTETIAKRQLIAPKIRMSVAHSCRVPGANRLCIDSKLAVFVGIKRELASILPFLKEAFEQDFLPGNSVIDHHNGTVAEFNEILSRIGYGRPDAQVIELDGDMDNNRDAAYNNCSRRNRRQTKRYPGNSYFYETRYANTVPLLNPARR